MVCPVGIDIAFLISKAKEALSKAGFSPQYLVAAGERAEHIGSPMGVTKHTHKATIRVQLFKVLSRSSFMSRVAWHFLLPGIEIIPVLMGLFVDCV
jgi:hypothetical protein